MSNETNTHSNRADLINLLNSMTSEQAADFFIDFQRNARNQELDGIVLDLYNRISKLRVLEGTLPTDPMICEILIGDKILRIPAEKIETPKVFKEQYYREFKKFIFITNNDWYKLANALAESKTEVVKCLEESDDVIAAREIFNIVKKLKLINDKNKFLNSNTQFIYSENEHFFVLSRVIKEIIEEYSRKVSLSRLSKAMCELGMKTEGYPKIDSNNRCWEFLPSALFDKN